ncbi:MAG: PLP-dependent aminotransferase family protein [Lautropia sp.]
MQAPVLSARAARLSPSPIREILSVIDRPGMISFAGGLPAPDSFPAIDVSRMPSSWLQYGPSEGEPALRERIARHLQGLGLDCGVEQVIVLSGSQQGIDLVAKLFVDPGTPVALESPTYLAALQVFRFQGMAPVTLDPGDPLPALASRARRPSFAYVIPTFGNPTGRCWSDAMREGLARAADDTGVPVFEDDPYRDIAFDRCERRPVCARIRRAPWIYQGSFSKRFAPGLRLGFMAASPALVPLLVRLKQAADLHSSRISQWLAIEMLDDPDCGSKLAGLVDVYRERRDHFNRALDANFGGLATWAVPAGGLFYWLELARAVDTGALLSAAIERGVAFMPGEPFFADPAERRPSLRLNFSHASPSDAARGLAILADLLRHARPVRAT